MTDAERELLAILARITRPLAELHGSADVISGLLSRIEREKRRADRASYREAVDSKR